MEARPEWEQIHSEVLALASRGARLEHARIRALLRAHRGKVWRHIRERTFYGYAKRFLGLSRRQAQERKRVGLALERLPLLDAALAEGRLHYCVVRELTRVATPETESQWVDAASEKTTGQVERLVSGNDGGEGAAHAPPPEARVHRVVLDLSADAYALYREAQAKLRLEHGEYFREEDGLILMARAILGGTSDIGGIPDDSRMNVSAICDEARPDGHGESLAAPVAESVAFEAPHIGASDDDMSGDSPAILGPVTQQRRCGVRGCQAEALAGPDHDMFLSRDGAHDPEGLVLCSGHRGAFRQGLLRIEGSDTRYRDPDGRRPHRAGSLLHEVNLALHDLVSKIAEALAITDDARPHMGPNTVDDLRLVLRHPGDRKEAPAERADLIQARLTAIG